MRRGVATAFTCLVALALLVPGSASAATAHPGKKNPRLQVVHAFTSAETAGAIATATATCPAKTARPDLGPWRAISGGFSMTLGTAGYTPAEGPFITPFGSGVVFESQKVGQRSWRVSAQSLWGRFDLGVSVNCQNSVPKTKSASSTVATPGTPQVGPEAVARCRTGKTVSGGFSTPPPFTATSAANTVIGSLPSGKNGWEAQALSNQASSLTSYVYCAKRKPVRLRHSPGGVATLDLHQVYDGLYDIYECPVGGKFLPGGGGFSEEGLTSSQYLIPVQSFQQGSGIGWRVSAIKVGSGVPVTLIAHTVCG